MSAAPSKGPSVGGRFAMLAVPLLVCLYLPMYYGIDAILKALYLVTVIVAFGGGIWWVNARLKYFDEAARAQQQQHYYTDQEEEGDNEEYTGAYGGNMSKKERKRREESRRQWERSKQGRRVFEVTGFIKETFQHGRLYCMQVGTLPTGLLFPYPLPDFQIAEREWKALVAEADRSPVWRASRNPQDLEKALEDVVNKAMEKRRKYQQRQKKNQPQGREAPQWNQQQAQGRKPVPQPTAHEPLSGKYADAAEQQPDLGSMSVRELRGFILQTGSSIAQEARHCTIQSDLVSLAQRCMQLWECTRLITCSKLPHTNDEQKLLAALCALRIPTGQGPRQPAAAAHKLTAADLKRRFAKLALLVHPDKVLAEHQDRIKDFDVAMKYLGNANALLSTKCASG